MPKFHVSSDGEPKPCKAQAGGCPLGGGESEHFSSKDEAREAYEKANSKNSVPATETKKPKKTTMKRFQEVIKMKEKSEIYEVATKGTDRELDALAQNPKVDHETLSIAFYKAKNEDTKIKLQTHRNFPTGMLTKEGAAAVEKSDSGVYSNHMRSDDLTDEATLNIQPHSHLGGYLAVSNPKNQLSENRLIELAEYNDQNLKYAVKNNPRYPVVERMDNFTDDQVEMVAINSSDPEAINLAIERVTDNNMQSETFIQHAVTNKNTPYESLIELSARSNNDFNQTAIYMHPNANDEVKNLAVGKSKTASEIAHVDFIKEDYPEEFEKLEKSQKVSHINGGKKQVIQFDADTAKKLGMGHREIDTLVRYHNRNFLQHTSYNFETGEYSGWID